MNKVSRSGHSIRGNNSKLGIQSVEVSGRVLRALIHADGAERLANLAKSLGMPSAKLHRYLVSMIRTGLAVQDASSGKYDLGPLALQLGLVSFGRFDLLKFAVKSLEALVDESAETAGLAVWTHRGPAMVRTVEATHEFAGRADPGKICPVTFSATGLIFCAFQPSKRLEELIDSELLQNKSTGRPSAPQTRDQFQQMLDQIKRDGLAAQEQSGLEGLNAVSAPVMDSLGNFCLALTVFGNNGRLNVSTTGELAQLVKRKANELSERLGQSSDEV